MRWRMALALRLMDEFTGQPLDGKGIWVRDDLGKPLISKRAGWFILMENGQASRRILINSEGYEPEKLRIDCKESSGGTPFVHYHYMIPGKTYCWPPGIKLKGAEGKPETYDYIPWIETKGLLRLAKDYDPEKESDKIALKLPKGFPVRERRLMISSGEEKQESFLVLDTLNDWSLMASPLERRYSAKEADITLLYRVFYDKTGSCFIPAL